MSSLIVEICTVEEVAVHDNADRLERVRVKNWWSIAKKGQYQIGSKVVFVPPDSILPEPLAERWGIAKYCVPLGRNINGEQPAGLRVRASRLRGITSYGTLQDPDDLSWEIGKDVREYYGITKYEPPIKALDGDAAPSVSAFHAYTDIEALGNFPQVFNEGEEVVVTEKLHGFSTRIGFVYHVDESGMTWQKMAGSHHVRRKQFNDKGMQSKYWLPFNATEKTDSTPSLFTEIMESENAQSSVIVFGETYGLGAQDMRYGLKGLAFRAFDLAVDGNYLDYDKATTYFNKHSVPIVPLLYRGPYSLKAMDALVDGPTTMCNIADIEESFKGREGIVIRPIKERFDPMLGGRAILKYVSADYHDRKNKDRTEDH
jgi:RNA ligase (TIGR02306 family)